MMSNGDYDGIPATLNGNDVIGESPEDEPFGSLTAGLPGHRRKRKKAVFYEIDSGIDSSGKIGPQARLFSFIPSRRSFRLFGGLPENKYTAHYERPSLAFILRLNSSRSSSSA